MSSYNVDYHVVIELLQILHKLGRGRSCDRGKPLIYPKSWIVSYYAIISHFVWNGNASTKISKKGDISWGAIPFSTWVAAQAIRSTTKNWVVHVMRMEFLRSLLRRRFARAQVATVRKVGCFLRLRTALLEKNELMSCNLVPRTFSLF